MADPERPLLLVTVIWFGSLEFMSLGYGYDMVLLPPRHPTDHNHELSQPGERCAGTTILAGLEQPGDGVPGVATTIISGRMTVCPILALLSQTSTQSLSMRTYVG
jgi:hypothetical protein